MFVKISQISQETHVLESIFNKVTGLKAPTQLFSCEISEIFKNAYFEEHLRTIVSVYS